LCSICPRFSLLRFDDVEKSRQAELQNAVSVVPFVIVGLKAGKGATFFFSLPLGEKTAGDDSPESN
jgi:hypothetical protein